MTSAAKAKNREGLTYVEWLRAAGYHALSGSTVLKTAWLRGDDPSEYRVTAPKPVGAPPRRSGRSQSMITAQRAAEIQSAHDRNQRAREQFDPKRFKRGGGYTPAEMAEIAKIAGVKEPSNAERGELEFYRFMTHPPDKFFAYYKQNASVGADITTWPGGGEGAGLVGGREGSPARRSSGSGLGGGGGRRGASPPGEGLGGQVNDLTEMSILMQAFAGALLSRAAKLHEEGSLDAFGYDNVRQAHGQIMSVASDMLVSIDESLLQAMGREVQALKAETDRLNQAQAKIQLIVNVVDVAIDAVTAVTAIASFAAAPSPAAGGAATGAVASVVEKLAA
jgi:hypothetical protein